MTGTQCKEPATKRREKRMPRIIERRLIGPMTCRVGLCGRDGTHRVACPGVRFDADDDYGERPVWVSVWYCRKHAGRCVAYGSPWRK